MGDKLRPKGAHMCNIWQGEFPKLDTADDGFAGTCPVDAFPPNGFGLYSITGNAWEWCTDWFGPAFHQTGSRIDPTGPAAGISRVMKACPSSATSPTATDTASLHEPRKHLIARVR